METTRTHCAACQHEIDASARLCPFCGANPATGERVDTAALLEEAFPKRTASTTERVLDAARQRQGAVIAISAIALLLILGALHQFVSQRNLTAVSNAAAVPLTEVSDLNTDNSNKPQPLPDLPFQFDGNPRTMRTWVMEPGAVTPPEVIAAQQAAQQAAAQAAAAKAAAAHPGQPVPGQPGQPAPAQPGAVPARPATPGVVPANAARPAVPARPVATPVAAPARPASARVAPHLR